MVEEAAGADIIVATHCHGIKGIMNAIHAGCKTIEHGSFLTEEAIKLMLENDIILVSPPFLIKWSVENPQYFDPASYQKFVYLAENHAKSYANAVKAGLRIALGADLGLSAPGHTFTHGTNATEFVYAVEAGMTPLQAIEAGTVCAPSTLGPQAPLSGQLRPGYDADIIALSTNPMDDIGVGGAEEYHSCLERR